MSRRKSDGLCEARRGLRELGERGRTARVPQRARRAVLAYVEAARDEGLAWWHIAQEVGLSETALRRWREELGGGDHVALLPVGVITEEEAVAVAVAAPARDAGGFVTLITPGGYRVEGLGVDGRCGAASIESDQRKPLKSVAFGSVQHSFSCLGPTFRTSRVQYC